MECFSLLFANNNDDDDDGVFSPFLCIPPVIHDGIPMAKLESKEAHRMGGDWD